MQSQEENTLKQSVKREDNYINEDFNSRLVPQKVFRSQNHSKKSENESLLSVCCRFPRPP